MSKYIKNAEKMIIEEVSNSGYSDSGDDSRLKSISDISGEEEKEEDKKY